MRRMSKQSWHEGSLVEANVGAPVVARTSSSCDKGRVEVNARCVKINIRHITSGTLSFVIEHGFDVLDEWWTGGESMI